ncbi:helix-turn-helix transcriptional regulator [Pseudolabrys taiwanensis]|nr:AraC family transcriptional regulator [Pseudolabrys taiwanensis]
MPQAFGKPGVSIGFQNAARRAKVDFHRSRQSKDSAMGKIVFSTDQFAGQLDDAHRFALWRDLYAAQYGLLDAARAEDRPFAAHLEFAQFGTIAAGWFDGALRRVRRTKHELRLDARDELFLFFNRGEHPVTVQQRGRETLVQPGMPALLNYYENGDCHFGEDHRWMAFTVSRSRLQALIRNVEDLVALPLDPRNEAMTHLRHYADFLHRAGAIDNDPALAEHVGQSLLDLIALALDSDRDTAALARSRGLRAARLRAVIAEIEAGFAEPGFSPGMVAHKLRLSLRYVQDLLHDTGAGFVERVTELRLQKARRMLGDPACDAMTIADIAYCCGFSEAPYFNRCFRKRFGGPPTSFRAAPR